MVVVSRLRAAEPVIALGGTVAAVWAAQSGGAAADGPQRHSWAAAPAAHRPSLAVIAKEMIKTCLLITDLRLLPPVNQSATVAH